MKKGNGYRRRRKAKPQKKTSTRDLAKKALKKVNEIEGEEEHKWLDQNRDLTRMRSIANWADTATMPLSNINPLQLTTISSAIGSFNKRIGAKVHLSGVYLNVQYSWPAITDSTQQRYPPFARIKYALVLQKKSVQAVAGSDSTAGVVNPVPAEVYQNQEALPITDSEDMPLSTMVFKSMRNGHNYRVLAEGDFTLSAPVATNIEVGELAQPGTVGQPLSQVTTLGETYSNMAESAPPYTKPTQFSAPVAKTIKIRVHPNCNTRYRPTPTGTTDLTDYVQPLSNGIYFMTWTDQSGSLARFQPPNQATWVYQTPCYWVNARTRFTDA